MEKGGLLRLTRFLRQFVKVVESEQLSRTGNPPSLLSVHAKWGDVLNGVLISFLLLSLRITLESTLFSKFFTHYSGRKRAKLGENLFYTGYYVFAFLFYWFYVRPAGDWGANLLTNDNDIVQRLILPYPSPMVPQERYYYAMSMGFYVAGTVFLVFADTRRSDFGELFLHHMVTLGLIGVSYAYGYVRVGMIVLALHDIGDIFLYFAKFLHYLGYAGWDTALFAVFTVTFYITRLLMLPRIVYAVSVETLQSVLVDNKIAGWAKFFDTYLIHYLFFVVFLNTLLLLHCFWFSLMLRMIYRELSGQQKITDQGDIRSDDEDDEHNEEEKEWNDKQSAHDRREASNAAHRNGTEWTDKHKDQ